MEKPYYYIEIVPTDSMYWTHACDKCDFTAIVTPRTGNMMPRWITCPDCSNKSVMGRHRPGALTDQHCLCKHMDRLHNEDGHCQSQDCPCTHLVYWHSGDPLVRARHEKAGKASPLWSGEPLVRNPYPAIKTADVLDAIKKVEGVDSVSVVEAVKYDSDKPRFDLIPPGPLMEVAAVMEFGARKYGDNNWRKGMKHGRLYGACGRHILAYWGGEDKDPETGFHHLAHALCCLFMLLSLIETHPELDDRP